MMQAPVFDVAGLTHDGRDLETSSFITLLDKAYAHDWNRFLSWCGTKQVTPVAAEPEAVAEFLEAEWASGFGPQTIRHRLAAIGHMHRRYRALPPLLHRDGKLIHVALARMGSVRVTPNPWRATTTILRDILLTIKDDTLEAARDRALLALRIAGAFQLSELAALSLSKIEREANRLEIRLGNWGSQTSARRNVLTIVDDAVLQPAAMLDDWLTRSRIRNGRVFRKVLADQPIAAPMTKSDIAAAIQTRAFAAGYDDDVLGRITARKSSANTLGCDV